MDDCIFCQIIEGKLPGTKLYEDDSVVAIKDKNPAAPVHVLIMPREHIPSIKDIQSSHANVLFKMFETANNLAKELGITDRGYRLTINCGPWAGQSVYHLHLHLLGGRAMSWPPG
jgi:histidine triad (HIT) family protein